MHIYETDGAKIYAESFATIRAEASTWPGSTATRNPWWCG